MHNVPLAKGPRKLLFGSVVEIRGLSQWSDEQIVDLAFVADEAVKTAMDSFLDTPDLVDLEFLAHTKPPTTAVLVVDNTAYISTSMKGGTYLYAPLTNAKKESIYRDLDRDKARFAVLEALEACQFAVTTPYIQLGHRNGASCAEIMALLAFVQENGDAYPTNARVVTLVDKKNGGVVIEEPCKNGRPVSVRFNSGADAVAVDALQRANNTRAIGKELVRVLRCLEVAKIWPQCHIGSNAARGKW